MFLKRRRISVPAFLEPYVYSPKGDDNDTSIPAGIRVHKSCVLTRKQLALISEFFDESDIVLSPFEKGMVISVGEAMTNDEVERQKERMSIATKRCIPSVEECIAKIHQETWTTVMVNMAKNIDLCDMEPRIDVAGSDRFVAAGAGQRMHLSQLTNLSKDKNISDLRVFHKEGSLCIMVNVKHKS